MMDQKERYVALLIRALIRKGVITVVGAMGGALAIGPAGFALGPMLTATLNYFETTTEEEQIAGWPSLTKNEIISLAIQIGFKLLVNNIHEIIKICKDIIRLLKRLFSTQEESVANAQMLLRYEPCY